MIRKYPGIFLLAFVAGGIVIADLARWPGWTFLLAALAFGMAGLLILRLKTSIAAALLATALAGLAAVHFALSFYDFGERHLARVIDEDQTCRIYGRVADWPDLKTNLTEITIEVDSLGGEINRKVEGGILLKVTDTSTALQIGDRVEFHAGIYPLRTEDVRGGGFDYGRYLRMKGISGIVYLPTLLDVRIDRRYEFGFYAFTDRLRFWITDCFNRNLPPDQAALASGFLIGETRDIPIHVYQQFRRSGTLHLLAVSGSNVALVLLVFLVVIRPFGFSRRARGFVLLGVLLLFTVISYGQPSVIRAAVMAGLVIIAGMLERRYDLNNIIALSAVIILLFDPGELYDVGFQLSYATAWGLIFVVPKLTALFRDYQNTRWYRWIVFPLIVSFVAQVVSTPLVLLYFGTAPWLSLPANLFIVPLTGVAVVGVMVLFLADLLLPSLGLFVGAFVSLILEALLRLVAFFGSATLPSIDIPPSAAGGLGVIVVILLYILLILATLAITSRRARRLVVWTVVLGSLVGLSFGLSTARESGERLCLTTIPGGVAGIRTQSGSSAADLILVNPASREYSISDRIIRPWLSRHKIRSIDKCFILGSDYRSLGDLFSLTDSIHITEMYLPLALRQSATDVLRHSGRSTSTATIRYFGLGDSTMTESPGYRAVGERVSLVTQGVMIHFTADGANLLDFVHQQSVPQIVVVGEGSSTLPPADSLIATGISTVICSKIEHQAGKRSVQPSNPQPSALYPFLLDLRNSGEIEIRLDDSLSLAR